jgi:drug/metabolite transporter (DMT)-like permease
MPSLRGVLFALTAFAVFAVHDVVVKFLGGHYSPFQIIFFSVLLSFPLVTLMLMRDPTPGHLRPVHPWWIALRTGAGVVTGASVFYAFSVLPLAQTYSVLFATPLLITVLSIPILGERVGIHRWLAVVFGLIGVLVVLRPGSSDLGLGHLAALTAASGSALASIIIRKIGRQERSVVLLLYPMVANFIVMAIALPFVYQPMPIQHLGMVGLISIFGFSAGLLLIMAYRNAEAAIVAPMQYSQILWASLFGYWIFGESLEPITLLGAAIIIASGLYIVFRESRASVSQNTPVLRTRTRFEFSSMFRISTILNRARPKQ